VTLLFLRIEATRGADACTFDYFPKVVFDSFYIGHADA
jgi:hypothetical protein